MIPRAIDMIFTVSSQLKDRGWKYQMEGSFLEVYNEVVSVDLLQCSCLNQAIKGVQKEKKRTLILDQRSSRFWAIRYQETRDQT